MFGFGQRQARIRCAASKGMSLFIGILVKDIHISNDLHTFLSKHRTSKKNSSQLLKEAERVIREIGKQNFGDKIKLPSKTL